MHERYEKEMQKAYREEIEKILAGKEKYEKPVERIGIESEVVIWKPNIDPGKWEEIRDAIIKPFPSKYVDRELGSGQIEIRTEPAPKTKEGIKALHNEMVIRVKSVARSAREHGCALLRIGANPLVSIENIRRTQTEKWIKVPDFHDANRRNDANLQVGGVSVGGAEIVSLLQSFHVNLGARSLEDALVKLNYSLMLGPVFLAIAGNAKYIALQDTGFSDARMHAWTRTHDTRTLQEVGENKEMRIGLPENYFRTIKEYLDRPLQFPFILNDPEHAFQIGIGLQWLDSRIKFINRTTIVEFRLLPTQPTIEDEIGLMLCWLGRLRYAEQHREALLPMKLVQKNREAAMRHGLNGIAWCMKEVPQQCTMRKLAADELQKAIVGLDGMLTSALPFVEPLLRRLKIGPPSEWLKRTLGGRRVHYPEEEMYEAMKQCGMVIE